MEGIARALFATNGDEYSTFLPTHSSHQVELTMTVVMTMAMTVRRKRMTWMVLVRSTSTFYGPWVTPGTCVSRFLKPLVTLWRKYNWCHFKFKETRLRRSHTKSKSEARLGFFQGRGHSLLPRTSGALMCNYFGLMTVLWPWKLVSSFACGFWQLQKCRLLSEDSIINDPAGGKDSGSRTSPEEESHPFAPLPLGHVRIVIAVILTQLFNNLNTGRKCQSNLFSSHYIPVLVTST